MDVAIAYCISVLSTLALVVFWFINTYKVLSRKKDEVFKAQEELQLHQDGYRESFGTPGESTARHMINTSTNIYKQIKSVYNKTLKKTAYRLPGFLMGFRTIE